MMYNYRRYLGAALFIVIAFIQPSFAESNYPIGAALSSGQVSNLGTLTSFTVGSRTYRILPNAASSGGNVINEQGTVGRCDGTIIISGVTSDQASYALSKYQTSISSIKTSNALNIVSATFSTITAAAKARAEIEKMIPNATVTLPITFTVKQLY